MDCLEYAPEAKGQRDWALNAIQFSLLSRTPHGVPQKPDLNLFHTKWSDWRWEGQPNFWKKGKDIQQDRQVLSRRQWGFLRKLIGFLKQRDAKVTKNQFNGFVAYIGIWQSPFKTLAVKLLFRASRNDEEYSPKDALQSGNFDFPRRRLLLKGLTKWVWRPICRNCS